MPTNTMKLPKGTPVWRSLMFVPVNVERFVSKAHTRGADYVIPPYAMTTGLTNITLRGLEKSRPEFFTCATEVLSKYDFN